MGDAVGRVPRRITRASLLAIWSLVALAILAMPDAEAAPAPESSTSRAATGQMDEVPERIPGREGNVYDTVDILTESQEDSIQNDLDRASWLGVEILVYTRMSDDSAAESQDFADQLNAQWNIESADGANDGIVYLVTVNPADPESNSIAISTGDQALPIRQLDRTTLQEILETEMAPAIDEGEFNTAIQYGVRRVLNYREYTPADVAPLTDMQQTFNTAASILGAGLVQVAIYGYFLVPIVRERRMTVVPSSRSLAVYAVTLSIASVITGLVAIVGRHAWSSLAALGLLIVATCLIPLLIGYRSRHRRQNREVHVRRRALPGAPTIGRAHG